MLLNLTHSKYSIGLIIVFYNDILIQKEYLNSREIPGIPGNCKKIPDFPGNLKPREMRNPSSRVLKLVDIYRYHLDLYMYVKEVRYYGSNTVVGITQLEASGRENFGTPAQVCIQTCCCSPAETGQYTIFFKKLVLKDHCILTQ